MKHVNGLMTAAEALRGSFVPATNVSILICLPRKTYTCQQYNHSAQQRSINYVAGGNLSSQPSFINHPMPRSYGPEDKTKGRVIRDESIRSRVVRVVTEDGIQDAQPLHKVLSSFNRKTHFLVQVSPPNVDEIPVCKILDKIGQRDKERAKAKPVKNLSNTSKQLELGWAISLNDLKHRMNKMQEFLREGRRVDILIAYKKKARQITNEEGETLIRLIREKMKEVEGAREWKEFEGVVNKNVTLYLEGKAEKGRGILRDAEEDSQNRKPKRERASRKHSQNTAVEAESKYHGFE